VTPASKRPWCEAADIVFAISETTRDDVVERFRLDPDRVVVTPLGVRAVAPAPDAVPAGAPPFVLYVGDRGHEHKNFESFVRAFARTAHHRELRLVCFGGGPFRPDELVLLRELGLADAEARGGSDAALAAHYRAARAFVYPSLYEGFGLPPLEAMINGCPVAAARAGSVPEVVGEAALLFDPEDEDAITAAIDRIVSDDALRTELIAAGHARALAYSWDNTVDLTLAAYERIGRRC
jgi:glycosyltransferase involved in cell wall biosynthesis